MQIPEKFKTPLMIGGVVVALTATLHLPSIRQFISLRQQISDHEAALAAGGTINLNSVRNTVAELQTDVDSFYRRPADAAAPHEVLAAVAETAQTAGVDTYDTRFAEPIHYRDFSVLPVQITLTSTFPAAFDVLAAVESAPRLMRVEQMRMFAADARMPGDAANKVSLELHVWAFFHPDREEDR